MKAADILREAKAIIADPDRWTKGTFADCGRYCALGALRTAEWSAAGSAGVDAIHAGNLAKAKLERVALRREYSSIATYNDSRWTRHEDVMSMFDEAIGGEE